MATAIIDEMVRVEVRRRYKDASIGPMTVSANQDYASWQVWASGCPSREIVTSTDDVLTNNMLDALRVQIQQLEDAFNGNQ